MFTGIIEAIGTVEGAVERRGVGARLALVVPEGWALERGGSLAVAGVCLTVAGGDTGGPVLFDLSSETLGRTRLGDLAAGDSVNLERPLRMGDPLGGHLVQGHVDGLGVVTDLTPQEGGCARLAVEAPEGPVSDALVAQGSIAVDGVSLTLADLDGRLFECALIPETLDRTTLGSATKGARVHLEADCLAKWAHGRSGG